MKAKGSAYTPFCICIVTHYPSPLCLERIHQLALAWPLYVFDNTPEPATELKENPSVYFFHEGANKGLGHAMHVLLKAVHEQGWDWAVYFDQDTQFEGQSLLWMIDWMNQHTNSIQSGCQWNFLPSRKVVSASDYGVNPERVLINSGSLFNLSILERLGYHNKNWFLECVDYELNLRMARSNLGMFSVVGCPGINHDIEQPAGQVYRIYPLKRSLTFVFRLSQLSCMALVHGPRVYSWIFLRNILTHCLAQLWSLGHQFMLKFRL